MQIIIMRGVQGSGKTTKAEKLLIRFYEEVERLNIRRAVGEIFSTDDFFMVDGKYQFDPAKLPEAHAENLRNYTDAVILGHGLRTDTQEGLLIVDNTNLTINEIAPYYQLAEAYGHQVKIITVRADPEICIARNIHGVPEKTIRACHARMLQHDQLMPPWWKHEVIGG